MIFSVSATDDDRATKPPPPKKPRGGEVTISTDEVASHEECMLKLQEECQQMKASKIKVAKAHEIDLHWKKSLDHQRCTTSRRDSGDLPSTKRFKTCKLFTLVNTVSNGDGKKAALSTHVYHRMLLVQGVNQ